MAHGVFDGLVCVCLYS